MAKPTLTEQATQLMLLGILLTELEYYRQRPNPHLDEKWNAVYALYQQLTGKALARWT